MKQLNLRMYAMVFALFCIWVIFTLVTDGLFLSGRNLFNLTRQAAVTAILAIGMVLVIISANIDLSVGFGAGLLGAVTRNTTCSGKPASYINPTHRLMFRHIYWCYTRVSCWISTYTSVYCYAGWFLGLQRTDVSSYKR